ncbi:MAG: hypothetical protein ABSE58_08280 [Candidatus Limnocylindrales bacterium]|jgi:hypothetical protein
MARDLTVAWELLMVVTRARQILATARPQIWEKARLPTAEHFTIVKASDDRGPWREWNLNGPEAVVVRVSIETLLTDGRRLASCLDVVAGPTRWLALPYIMLTERVPRLVWAGPTTELDESAGFAGFVDSAANSLVKATVELDFGGVDAL